MLEDAFWEEDIWEYKSKRKPKPVHPNSCSENISESVEKATDGKYQSKGKGNKKRTSENPGETKDHPVCLAETNSQISAGSSQNSSCRDDIQQSQSKETTPKKQCRTNRGKQATPKVRPLYDGHCPSCQMPFSSLLGQTPRWHVFECLDSPPISDTECPDGVLCSSTIPSHYKKYTHVLLAQSRDSKEPLSPSQALAGRFAAAQPDSCNLEERRSVLLKTEDSRKVLEDSLLMIQCLKTSQPPAETNRKSASSPRSQKSLVPQRAEFVKRDQLVGSGSPLAEVAFNCQSESGSTGLPLPENGCGDFEISYSPLHSDEETYNCDQELDDSQQELFFTQSSKDSSLEDVSATFENLHGPFPEEAEGIQPTAKTLAAQAGCSALSRGSTGNDSFQLISRTSGRLSGEDPSDTDAAFLLLSPAPSAVGGATPNCQTTKAKPEKFHSLASRHQQQKTETSAAGSHTSLPLLLSAMSKPLEKEGGERLPLHPTQSQRRGLWSKGSGAPGANCACSNTQRPSSAPLNKSLSTAPSSPKGSASQPSKKVMKQMDIGVFFGLPPKTQDTSPRERASEGPKASPVVSPSEKRPRLCKRKAQSSLSDLEFDAKNLNESQHSMELSGERAQHRRKRHKKSNSPQEGTYQGRSGHLTNNPELGAVSLRRSKAFARRTPSRTQRGAVNISESSGGGESRRTCPFYKRIPGTGFTVDAFQYGEIEGCTAYFLTHFHSDHYAGLSKDFTRPIYCSEITGSLLKKKLRVQEQYIHQLPMDTECIVDGVKVVLLDANQYCSPEYTFPSQQEAIQFAINTAFEAVTLNPRALIVCGTYCIGKEKVFLAIADVLGSKVGMSQEKYKTLQCLNIPEVSSLITTDMCNSLVHLLPMMQINFKGLQNHLKKCGGKFDQILAFRPTGWTHSNNITSIADITPQTKGNIAIYGIPYSEHSSYLEMKRFVQWLKPQKIIPTVNVGTFQSRNTMEKYFKEWRLEAGY
ncbi:DNA cross-link repair 1A protein isoform X2 [Rattus norvegicus]|uniref:DNA cross-link repair 1A protein isoform X2 n=1 Tax=Rattus norvegicus TaxID=10116 RepID=UPI0019174DCE|nr:DNA cross-link repair 1A protein isoform X2 [Rattus norvegicus]